MNDCKINNLPEYTDDKPYIVARLSGGKFWFWGAFDSESAAEQAANELRSWGADADGMIIGVMKNDPQKPFEIIKTYTA